MTRVCLAMLVVLAGLAGGPPAAAQDFRGGIRGTIVDATGGVLPGVTVTVTNTATGVSQTVVTDDKGLFQVLYLNAGTYTVTAELSGFKKVVRAGNEVRVGDVAARRRRRWRPAASRRPCTVTAETPLLNTTHRRQRHDGRQPSRSRSCRSATARPTC